MSTTPPTPSDPTTGSATLTPARPRTLGSRATPHDRPAVPASAAWHEGDPMGRRQFADLGPLKLESGGRLPAVRLAYETWGELNEDGTNAVLVLHALTGDSHVTGPATAGHRTAGWWQDLVGPGAPVDTDRWFVVAPNVLGGCQGSTGPASPGPDGKPWGSRFPLLTVRDQVAAEIRLSDLLGIDAWSLVIGASLGGLRVLEWAASAPERVEAIAAIATAAQTSGDQIAGFHTQLAAIRADPRYRDGDYYDAPDGEGPSRGLSLARRMAMLNYRTAAELNVRFERSWQSDLDPLGGGGRFAVESYLDFHGNRFTRRFDANSYLVLTEAMNSHDIGRGRGGVAAALADIRAKSLVLGIDSDRYFTLEGQQEIAAGLRRSVHGDQPVLVHSEFGHDAFLIEHRAVGEALRRLLAA
jgi:homoserine O-acetyltransferase